MIESYNGKTPRLGKNCKIHKSAVVIGDVSLGNNVSVWPGAVLRGDIMPITVGDRTNIQDGCILHTDLHLPCVVDSDVTVGHGAILHSCTIQKNALVGMGAIVLDGAVVEQGAIVGAGSLVPPGKTVAKDTVVMGNPCRVVREVSAEEKASQPKHISDYVNFANKNQGME